MAIDFEKLRGEVLSATRTAGERFNDASAQAKKRLEIRGKEEFIKEKYIELGQAYYEAHKDDAFSEYQEIFDAIRNKQIEIDAINDQLLDEQGVVICPQCGMKQSKKHIFCSNCGSALQ